MNADRIRPPLKTFFSLILALTLTFSLGGSATQGASQPATQSYILQAASATAAAQLVTAQGGVVTSSLELINGVAADLTPAQLARLRVEAGVRLISPNAPVQSAGKGKDRGFPVTDYPDVTGADQLWGQGVMGQGVTVAVVDTGFTYHPGILQGIDNKVRGRILGWKDFVDKRGKLPHDPNGHGSHITGIILNSQYGGDKEYNGMAPGASLVGVRVLDETGAGTYEQVINGIQWVVEHKDEYNIRVMNLSLVSPVQSPYWADPLNQAVTRAWASGITVVAAAGNGGPGPMTIGVPGNNPYVITVGAFTDHFTPQDWNDDYMADFSAAGPTLDAFVKPDVVAPGGHIVSTMLPNSVIARNHEANRVTANYFSMAGTSQAAASVSGVAALILSAHPELTPDQVKYRIQRSALPWIDPNTTEALYSVWQQGAGRVNALDAVQMEDYGAANQGMDILADLDGVQHYEGFSYYDEGLGQFRLNGDFNDWGGGYWVWDGKLGSWSGGYGSWGSDLGAWAGKLGSWSGSYGVWSGKLGSWSGSFGVWSGGYGAWSGGYGSWAGGYTTWAGKLGSWSGGIPWAETAVADPAFCEAFLSGVGPNASTRTTFLGGWVEEP